MYTGYNKGGIPRWPEGFSGGTASGERGHTAVTALRESLADLRGARRRSEAGDRSSKKVREGKKKRVRGHFRVSTFGGRVFAGIGDHHLSGGLCEVALPHSVIPTPAHADEHEKDLAPLMLPHCPA